MFHRLSKHLEFRQNTPLRVFSTLLSVFGYPDEALTLVFDIFLQMFTQGACFTDSIQVWEMVITVTTVIYLLIEVHQACSEVSSVNLFLL